MLVTSLLEAIQLPRSIAILHCRAHTGQQDDIAKGNALADKAAREAASTQPANIQMPLLSPEIPLLDQTLRDLQAYATDQVIQQWNSIGVQTNPETDLVCQEGRPCIPVASAPIFISQYHGIGHRGWKVTCELLDKDFYIPGLPSLIKAYVSRCITCIRNNPSNPHKAKHEHLIYPSTPFTHLQIDFTHMPKLGKRQEYLLIIVDMFSRWIELFVTTKEDAQTVVRILIQEIIPRWGCPLQINSDNGPAFVAKVCQDLVKTLKIEWKFHIPYHPQSSGIVERMNRTIKDKIRKATGGTYANWKKVLPAVLAEVRMTPSKKTGYSPFEVLMGRPFPTPWARQPLMLERGDLDLIQEEYVKKLIETLDKVERNVARTSPSSSQEPTHPFQVGDTVVVQRLNRTKKQEYPFGPPTTVIAVTRTAILVEGQQAWIHASRVKKVNQDPKKQGKDKAQRGEAGEINPRTLSEAGGQDSEQDDVAYFTTDFWEGLVPPMLGCPDCVPANLADN